MATHYFTLQAGLAILANAKTAKSRKYTNFINKYMIQQVAVETTDDCAKSTYSFLNNIVKRFAGMSSVLVVQQCLHQCLS